MKKKWYEQKTFWTGVGIVLTALWPALLAKDLALVKPEIVLAGLGLIFMRQGVENSK